MSYTELEGLEHRVITGCTVGSRVGATLSRGTLAGEPPHLSGFTRQTRYRQKFCVPG